MRVVRYKNLAKGRRKKIAVVLGGAHQKLG